MSNQSLIRPWGASVPMALAGLLIALAISSAAAPAAHASEYGLSQLVSRPSTVAQPNGPVDRVAVSSNGRYILYELDATNMVDPGLPAGSPPNAGGVYRYDTQTGASELVAYGYFSNYTSYDQQPQGAENAAISTDGRYVLFDSNQLFPSDSSGQSHVYIRDMTKPVDDPGAYTMPIGTADARAVGAHGFSNDGTRLLWTSLGNGSYGSANYGVVYWTDLSTGVTLPVSVAYDQSSHTMNPNLPLTDAQNTRVENNGTGSYENAVLSGDGTTVAWYSNDVTQDTARAPGESTGVPGVVWRRIADGARAVTRRVTTAADIENPACTPATPITTDPTPPGPCDDAQLDTSNIGEQYVVGTVVGLSDDGQKVAVLADGHPRGSGIGQTADVYVVGMFPGQDPVTTIQPVTRALPGSLAPDTNASITAATISGDGRYVAFATQRILFPMDPPTQIGTFPAFVGADQLYLVDLQDQHIQLLSVTPSGADQDAGVCTPTACGSGSGQLPGGVSQPVLSEDAQTIAFMSSSDNLAPGIANGFPNAFTVQRQPTASGSDQTGPQVEQLPATAPDLSPQPDWSLLVDSVSSHGNRSVTVTVEPPAAGSLSATVADGGVRLAAANATAGGSGPVTLTLRPHVTDAQGNPGVSRTRSDTAVVEFTPRAGAGSPIRDRVPVTFKLPAEKVGARARPVSAPRAVRLALTLPAPGRVTVAATRQTREGHQIKTITVARATRRGTRAGSLAITLAPGRSGRRGLPAGRVPLHLKIHFVPASAGTVPPLERTLSATLAPAKRKSQESQPTGRK